MKESKITRILKQSLGILFFLVVIFLFVGERILPAENPTESGSCILYEGEWERILSDGSRIPIDIPGNYDAKSGETFVLETILPEDLQDTWFCMRASQQDMKVFVGDELRKEYNTKETRLFGENSASTFVFFRISNEDAGKALRIELVSQTEYAGFLNEVYMGDKYDIVRTFIKECVSVLVVSFTMLILGTLTVIASVILRFVYKKRVEIAYLGFAILVLSLAMLVESRVRQFFIPNASVAEHVGFLLTMLVPYPFSIYINKIQKGRYERYFLIPLIGTTLNFVLATALQLLNIVEFMDSMIVSYGMIGVMLVVTTVTIIIDLKRGRRKEYGELMYGILAMVIVAAWEIYVTFFPEVPMYGGVALSVGLVILLFMAGVKTVREMLGLEREKQKAIAAGEAKTAFLASMSHEIRTPINTIIGMNEMILREGASEEIGEYARNVQNASRMLLGLVNDILDFSKIEAGKMDILEGDYRLPKILSDVAMDTRMKAEDKGLIFKLEVVESLPTVLKGDEIRIRQILNNLLSNAVKYTSRGEVTLSVKGIYTEEAFALHMMVLDTGMGIKPEDLEKLFVSFKRLDEKKNRYIEGNGLGLSITKQLVELMNGDIKVESKYGEGSCFTVIIPQAIIEGTPIGKLEHAYQGDKSMNVKETIGLYAPNAKVLVVDDNEMNLKVVHMLLKRTEMKLTMARSGMECLDLCREQKYDLILMDHMMPELDGIETLHILQNDVTGMNQETPVIALTANAISGMAEKYMEEGFADYISKPVVAETLEHVIARHLGSAVMEEPIQEENQLFAIDKRAAMSYCMNDVAVYQEIREEFCKQGGDTLKKLDEYYRNKDWKNYKIQVHAIKSTALVVGAVAFSERAKELEKVAAEEKEEILLIEGEKFFEEYEHILELLNS